MKQLILFRHARAEKPSIGTADIERKLSPKGHKEAIKMAYRMRIFGNIPELIISSPANRAIETAQILAKGLEHPLTKIVLEPLLYSDDSKKIRSMLKTIDDKYDSVMLVGHNPILEEIAGFFTGDYEIALIPASCCCVEFSKNHWRKLIRAQGVLKFLDFPGNKAHKSYLSRQVRKNLTALISTEIKNELTGIDISAYEATEKALQSSIRKIVKKFVKSLKTEKLESISQTEMKAESPPTPGEDTAGSTDSDVPNPDVSDQSPK